MSTLFAILSSLIKVYTFILSSLIRVKVHYHSQEQSDQGLHCLSFSIVWSRSRSTFSETVWSGSTLFAIDSSLIRVYTVCHSQQSDQHLHCLPFSAVWSGSTLFAIISSLIRVYTIFHSEQSDQGLQYLPFLAVWSRVYTVCHSEQSDQGLHYLPFSVWSASTIFAILSSLIRVFPFCHSFLAVLSRSTLFAILSSLIWVYNYSQSQQSDQVQTLHCHSYEQSDQGLRYLPFAAVRSGSTLFSILSSHIRVYTVSISQRSDQGLHYFYSQSDQSLLYLPLSAVWSGSALFAILP